MADYVDSKPLSEDLRYWRAERPDEWIMERFIRKATALEAAQAQATAPNSAMVPCHLEAGTRCEYREPGNWGNCLCRYKKPCRWHEHQ